MKKVTFIIVLTLVSFVTAYSQTLSSGYRGFIEAGICGGGLKDATILGPQNVNRLNIGTVHGYQFNPRFYLGGGFVHHIYTEGHYSISLFADIRVDFMERDKTPFINFRGGHCYGDFHEDYDFEGGYLAFSAGYRFNRCNFSVGWEGSPVEYSKNTGGSLADARMSHLVANSFLIKFGFDWGARH